MTLTYIILLGTFLVTLVTPQVVEATANISFTPTKIDGLLEGQIQDVYFNMSCISPDIHITVISEEEHIADVIGNQTIKLYSDDDDCVTQYGRFTIRGIRLGKTTLRFYLDNATSGNTGDAELVLLTDVSYSVVILRERNLADDIFRYGIIVLAALLYIGFGCKIDLGVVKEILKKPISPAVGILCQFLIMPLIGFGLGQLFDLETALAFGVLTLACSPGGGSSNVWVNLLDGDLDLSLTMTTISTFLSLGAMPLWIFALGRFYIDPNDVDLPYVDIVRSLLTIVVPLIVGLLVRRFAPKVADWIARATRPFSGIFVVYILTFGTYVNWYMFVIMGSMPLVIPVAILLPLLGYTFGLGIALLCRRTRKTAVTISIETGVQNASIPIIVLQGNFPQPEGDIAAVMPVAASLFYTIPILFAWLGYLCYKRAHKEFELVEDDNLKEVSPYTIDGDIKYTQCKV